MSITEDCCKPAPPAVDDAVGKEELVADVPAYVTGSHSASAAVIFISDLFGFDTPLLRRLADKVAKAGYFVVVPDFFHGDPFVGGQGENLFQGLDTWLPKHMPNGSVGDVKKIVEYLRAKGISSFGASGFCWGAKVAALLGKDDTFRALVQLHPSLADASDYEEVKPPIAVLASPTDQAEELAAPILGARTDIKSFVKVFPNVFHGWTVRYDENDPEIVAKAEEAHKDMLDWYAKYLPVTATETTTTSSSATTTIPKTIKELLPAKLIE
jgi:dienelactone hydrolase